MTETLTLPRILCLHGGGTNARIFRMQCRVLTRLLRPYFRLVFAEAPIPTRPGPDVTAAYKDYGPFKAWVPVRPEDPAPRDPWIVVEQLERCLAEARRDDDSEGATGEWVGLLGFSQGALLAASILANQQERGRCNIFQKPGWGEGYRFAILLAGRGPLRWLHPNLPMPRGFVDAAAFTTGGSMVREVERGDCTRLSLPTVHVHGLTDPGRELHRQLLELDCEVGSTMLVEWGGEHRVPIKAKDVEPVVQEILAVARRTGVLSI